ncbi:MAG TPA: LLM class flavin-dependent oxidoreductase [Chromatiales bacterium]|nr:LLM class flavin-dependent oxidoreductase [Chromatiales bacterium]
MQIDIFIPPGLTAAQTVELGTLAEANGIRALYTYNYVADPDPFINLSLLAQQTRTLRMGPGAVSPFQMHPLLMANSLLTLNEISHGRADIVIGGGGAVMTAMGLRPLRKVRAVSKCVEFLRLAAQSQNEPLNFDGDLFTARDYQAHWVTQPPPRLLVGANGPQMIRMATRVADGIMTSDFTVPMVQELMHGLSRGRARRRREAGEFEVNNFFAWHLKSDRAESRAEARRYLVLRGILRPRYLLTFISQEDCDFVQAHMGAFWAAYNRHSDKIEGVPDRIVDQLIDNLALTGDLSDIDRILEHLHEFEATGLTAIALGLHDDPAEGIRQIGRYVVPEFTSR